MAVFRAIFLLTTLVYLSDVILGQSDLRSALAAIDRRQKELADYEEQQQYGYNQYDPPDELAFLNNAAGGYDKDYLDDEGYNALNKRLTSSFRERLEEDKQKQMEEFARNLINNLESNGMPAGAVDESYLRDLWDRYYGNDIGNYGSTGLNKRYYYPSYGIENVGLRKKGRFVDNDDEPIYSVHHHVPRMDDSEYQYLKKRYLLGKSYSPARYSYPGSKRFSVSKRSSTYNEEQKRPGKKQTDPKVEKDLSNIFGGEQKTIKKELNKDTATTSKPDKNKMVETTTKKIFCKQKKQHLQ